jgi:hypothetical protein
MKRRAIRFPNRHKTARLRKRLGESITVSGRLSGPIQHLWVYNLILDMASLVGADPTPAGLKQAVVFVQESADHAPNVAHLMGDIRGATAYVRARGWDKK